VNKFCDRDSIVEQLSRTKEWRQSVAKFVAANDVYLVTPGAAARLELLFHKPAPDHVAVVSSTKAHA
jgi:hypothetical protein